MLLYVYVWMYMEQLDAVYLDCFVSKTADIIEFLKTATTGFWISPQIFHLQLTIFHFLRRSSSLAAGDYWQSSKWKKVWKVWRMPFSAISIEGQKLVLAGPNQSLIQIELCCICSGSFCINQRCKEENGGGNRREMTKTKIEDENMGKRVDRNEQQKGWSLFSYVKWF